MVGDGLSGVTWLSSDEGRPVLGVARVVEQLPPEAWTKEYGDASSGAAVGVRCLASCLNAGQNLVQ